MFRKLIHGFSNKRGGMTKHHPLRKKTAELRELTIRLKELNQKPEKNS